MKLSQIKTIIKKELLELYKDRGLIFSLLTISFILSIVLPTVILLFGVNEEVTASISGLKVFLDNLAMIQYPSFITERTLPLYAIFIYFFLPIFMLLPITIATILSSSSIIGEKEKKTLEGLLYTPIPVKVLILGKALAAAIPSVLLTTVSVISYTLIVNILGWQYFGNLILPNTTWILMTFVVSPLLIFQSILLVIGSSQYLKNSKSAQGIVMIIVAPIIGILISQATGVLVLGFYETIFFIVILIFIVLGTFLVVVKRFDFEKFILNN